jgi:nicotinate-nucleotide adenylyltransferase
LSEIKPDNTFSIIMGSDSFQNINNWKNYESIVRNYPFYIYKRPGFEIKETFGADIKILTSPLLEISATQIRDNIKNKKSIRYLVPESVREEIESRQLYKKV